MILQLKSVKNIRDFSEYGYKDCIRSAHLNRLSAAEADILVNRHGLRTVIDLRTPGEVKEKPDRAIPGVKYINIPVFEGAVPGISHEKETDKLHSVIPDMPEMYRLLVTEESYVRNIKKAMDIITDPNREGAVLWHCSEGKDRCGIVSALFLLSRGADKQEVIADYLLTNLVNKSKASRFYYLTLISGRGKEFAGKVRDAFLAKREYIEPIMDKLAALSGEYPDMAVR